MRKTRGLRLLAALTAGAVCAPAFGTGSAAAAGAPPAPEEALEAARAALDPDPGAPAARDTTLAMRDLALAVPKLRGKERRAAIRILARPTDNPDPNRDTYAVREEPPLCNAHFCVHYVRTTPDAPSPIDANLNGVPDYVESVLAAAEASYNVQNQSLGWPRAKSDGTLGGGNGLTDIYIANVGDSRIFGYAVPDPPPAQQCARSCFSYLVVDNDYSPAEYGYPDPGIPLRVTLAHEYNHVLQFGIDAVQDGWLFESTAVWAEEKTFPNDNDYLNYLPRFAKTSTTPITQFSGGRGLRIYGLGVFQHWLDSGDGGYGPEVVLGSWKSSTKTKPKDFGIAAVDRSIRQRGGKGFAQEFVKFAAATAEWQVTGGFPDSLAYPTVKRKGKLGRGRKTVTLDHTSYALFDVRPGSKSTLKLKVKAERGTESGIALVGLDADSRSVTKKVKVLKRGGNGAVKLKGADEFERVTAVLVNADGRVKGYDRRKRDWIYSRNNARYRATIR